MLRLAIAIAILFASFGAGSGKGADCGVLGDCRAGAYSADGYNLAALAGVDPTGVKDSTAAINAAFSQVCSQTNAKVVVPAGATFKISSTIEISGCTGLLLDCESGAGHKGGFVWNGPPGGTVMEINRTGHSIFRGCQIYAGTANIGLNIDESPTGSTITTHNTFEHITVSQNSGAPNARFIGIDLASAGPGNVEQQIFRDILLYCGNTPNSGITATSNGIGFLIPDVAGPEPFHVVLSDFEIGNCSRGIDIHGADTELIEIEGGLTENDYTDLMIESGHLIEYRHVRSEGAVMPVVLSSGDQIIIDHAVFSGLPKGGTAISLPKNNATDLTVSYSEWDDEDPTQTVISRNISGHTVLLNNRYRPGCPDLSGFGAVIQLMSMDPPTMCDTYFNWGLSATPLRMGLPTKNPHVPGALWNNGGVVSVSSG